MNNDLETNIYLAIEQSNALLDLNVEEDDFELFLSSRQVILNHILDSLEKEIVSAKCMELLDKLLHYNNLIIKKMESAKKEIYASLMSIKQGSKAIESYKTNSA